jgi:hypothetical protein
MMQEIDEQFRKWELAGDEWRETGDRVLSSAGFDFAGKRAVSRSISHTDGVRVQGRQGVSVQALRSTQEALEAAGLEE